MLFVFELGPSTVRNVTIEPVRQPRTIQTAVVRNRGEQNQKYKRPVQMRILLKFTPVICRYSHPKVSTR